MTLALTSLLLPESKVPSGYRRHFQSFDGKERKLVVEGVGGPSWFAEYNVLTGLSVRSFGRFATSVTRIAAGLQAAKSSRASCVWLWATDWQPASARPSTPMMISCFSIPLAPSLKVLVLAVTRCAVEVRVKGLPQLT